MVALGNVIWFVFGGFFLALAWLFIAAVFAITIIGLPIARACFEFAKLSSAPFGKGQRTGTPVPVKIIKYTYRELCDIVTRMVGRNNRK